ncbi:hypothetical protein VKT23_014169 [Stygiomarasmius scandens]|uniref:Uncharacterized protein n=1 Tax=Marasmiellus scandens TaxID=2682957 RepID=A0ABR1J6F2_9AGAR
MFIYNGKLNWFNYAVDECFTIVLPAGVALNDPVSAHWQWTVDASGNKKKNVSMTGTIGTVTTNNEYRIGFAFNYYSFEAVVSNDFKTLTVTMRNPKGDHSDPMTLTKQYSPKPSTTVLTGKLNWLTYADNEMVTLVIPCGVSNGAPVGLYFEWTVDANGNKKGNVTENSTFREVSTASSGDVTGVFGEGYYTYKVTMASGGQEATLHMSNPGGSTTSSELKKA